MVSPAIRDIHRCKEQRSLPTLLQRIGASQRILPSLLCPKCIIISFMLCQKIQRQRLLVPLHRVDIVDYPIRRQLISLDHTVFIGKCLCRFRECILIRLTPGEDPIGHEIGDLHILLKLHLHTACCDFRCIHRHIFLFFFHITEYQRACRKAQKKRDHTHEHAIDFDPCLRFMLSFMPFLMVFLHHLTVPL